MTTFYLKDIDRKLFKVSTERYTVYLGSWVLGDTPEYNKKRDLMTVSGIASRFVFGIRNASILAVICEYVIIENV
jgi:hypothetical protein